ncbi:MAG: hypothetical protein ACRD3J_31205, partial [Thermoanaerobaculia bacterium]
SSDQRYVQPAFVSPNVLRLYLRTSTGWKIFEVDAKTRGVIQTGETASSEPPSGPVVLDADASHMLVRGYKSQHGTLDDARTGALIAPVGSGPIAAARFLRDGRVVYIDGPNSHRALHVLSKGTLPERSVPIGAARFPRIIGDDGKRVVVENDEEILAIGLDGSAIERHERAIGVMATASGGRTAQEPLREVFYVDENNHVVAWNPSNGAKKMVTGG